MRDDLHRTVSLPRPWRSVLRYVCRKADAERVPEAITRAVQAELGAGIGKGWSASFKAELETAHRDLFRSESQGVVITEFEQKCGSSAERKLCDTARGVLARDGARADLFDHTLGEVFRSTISAGIEHACAMVRREHGQKEAGEVRARLAAASKACKVEEVPKRRRGKDTKEAAADLLNRPLRLRVP